MEQELEQLATFFKVLNDLTRLKILYALEGGELTVNQIAEEVMMTVSAVSHQLRVLREHKLVKARKEGKYAYYSLDDDHVQAILEIALIHLREA
ncbi:metalloregulator ArsR/SmtB family transcription factor [Aerococcaceae bacterium NML210727]|nr:metalloregulator ArsR/SmtB family transcription factor [Aerococcaceae bacterium NML210727]MCW6653949.1 metalloregulator ArsR/SmtB family transcription factor [Aerococcaceae bacterium NML201296]MCW6663022.1 metalloregulator ArsR/SmtB family transcription factor [Aerococcaceae bacterium NML190073]MCW6666550.1 metalloregulator ArsR/SmtB family transcription factor [Aerococcaceae bacterium NML190938]MCW6676335.1 metalloregulator ArsR/SmtB family transcription factor [Aerococcaceae bacterium NML1